MNTVRSQGVSPDTAQILMNLVTGIVIQVAKTTDGLIPVTTNATELNDLSAFVNFVTAHEIKRNLETLP